MSAISLSIKGSGYQSFYVIELSFLYTELKLTIWVLSHQNWEGKGSVQRDGESFLKVVNNVVDSL